MNLLESLIPTALAESIGLTFMHALWQLAGVALLLLLALQFVPRKASRVRYSMGVGAMAIMPVLAIVTFFMVYRPAPEPQPMPDLSVMLSSGQILELEEHFAARESKVAFLTGISNFFNENARLLFALWALGSMVFALRFLLGYIRVQHLRRRNTLPVPEEIQSVLDGLRQRMRVNRNVQLLLSGSVDTPMVIGALRPVVLLPMGLLTGLSPEQVECILAHELAHIRRWDFLVNIFQSLVEIMFFFHPAVWWVSNLVREERENCCDEAVLTLKNNNIVYARALLNLESFRAGKPGLAMASNGGSLFKRIKRITGAESRETRFYSRGLFVAMLTLTLVLVLSTSGSEQMKASTPMMNLNYPGFRVENTPDAEVAGEEQPQKDPATTDSSNDNSTDATTEETDEEPFSASTATGSSGHILFPGLDRMLQMVSGIPSHTAQLLDETGSKLRYNLDERIFSAYLAQLNARRDTPVSKLTLLEDGKEIVIELDRNGEVEKVLVDGKPAPQSDYGKYKRMATSTFRTYLGQNDPRPRPATAPPVPPIPGSHPLPPAPAMRGMPPIPVAPQLGKVPAPPSPPDRNGLSEKEFERAMEEYEEAMEDWSEELEAQFENGDWKRFEEEMEAWGEAFGEDQGEQWEQFGREMERWGEEFAKEMESQDWEKFGEEMERWGEQFARQFEHLGEDLERQLDHERERVRRDRDRMQQNADRARIDAERARREAERYRSGVDRITDELVREGLIDQDQSYKIKINDDEFYVNGNRQTDGVHRRFKSLIERELGVEVSDEWVEINKKKGSTVIKDQN